MQIIRNLNQINQKLPDLALTIGNFDGVHLGHQEIIKKIIKISKEKGLKSAILSFEPHPISFLRKDIPQDFKISCLSEKLKIFKSLGIDFAIILPFNQELADITAENFIQKILIDKLSTKHLIIGYDFIFGKNREGNFRLLEQESKRLNFVLEEISAIKKQDYTCSSTIVRSLIKSGKIKEANEILGKNFIISGIVNEGKKLASQLGFPTANLKPKPFIIKPKYGVYKTITFIPFMGKKFNSITNFGIKPTIEDKKFPIFETHILNFNHNIYNQKIYIEFVDFIREEKKFSSILELKKQIEEDIIPF